MRTDAILYAARRLALTTAVVGSGSQVCLGRLDVATVALALLAVLLALPVSRNPGRLRLADAMPPAFLAFGAAFLAAATNAGWPRASLLEGIQLAATLGMGLWVAAHLSGAERDRVPTLVFCALVANLLVAVVQLLAPAAAARGLAWLYGHPWPEGIGPSLAEELATGLFPSHGLYAGFVVLAYPWTVLVLRRRRRSFYWVGLTLVGAVAVQTLFSVCFIGLLALVGVVAILAGSERVPRRNTWLVALCAALLLATTSWRWLGPTHPPSVWTAIQPFTDIAGQQRTPKRLLLELSAAIESLRRHPLGWGPGTYPQSIHQARAEAELPQPTQNRVRRDSHGQYLVLAIELGVPGILALLYLLASAVAIQACRASSAAVPYPGVMASRDPGVEPALREGGIGTLERQSVERGNMRRQGRVSEAADGANPGEAAALLASLLGLIGAGALTLWLVRGVGALAGLLLGLAFTQAPVASSTDPQTPPWSRLLRQAGTGLGLALLLIVCLRDRSPIQAAPLNRNAPLATSPGLVLLEAETCDRRTAPFVVLAANHTGHNQVLAIPAGAGKDRGEATYTLTVTQPGSYKLWLRALWSGGCANSVVCQVGEGRPVTVEDAIFDRWHWVDVAPAHRVDLPAGTTGFRLMGTEDGIQVDQIAFLADPTAVPAGILTDGSPEPAPGSPADGSRAPQRIREAEAPRDEAFDKYPE